MMRTLNAVDVRKTFIEGRESVEVLKGVSLDLSRGEIVALEGPSGSGKTTFLSILGCILSPSSGLVEVNGIRVDNGSPKQLAAVRREHIGFVFQQFNLFPALNVIENVEYALNIKGYTKQARKMAEAAIDSVGLTDRANFLPRDLSGGQKQRVAIARALASAPAVLLADEPTANLDSQIGMQILELFRDLAKKKNQSLLIVTHDPEVRTIVDRVVAIRDGMILQESIIEK